MLLKMLILDLEQNKPAMHNLDGTVLQEKHGCEIIYLLSLPV
jgi:hypothetical protein